MIDQQKIEQLSAEADRRINDLTTFVKELGKAKDAMNELCRSQERRYIYELQSMRKDIHEITEVLKRHGLPLKSDYEKGLEEVRALLESPLWREAVPAENLCDNDDKAFLRAESII